MAGVVSVISVAVLAAFKVINVPVKVPPATVVVMVWAVTPLVPVKPKSPTPPFEILRKVRVGSLMLLMVQVEVWPSDNARLEPVNVPAVHDQVPAV